MPSDKIFELLSNLDDKVTSIDKKLDLHVQRTEFELARIHDLDLEQNQILEEHHKRSDALAKDNILREESLRAELLLTDKRISKLEHPFKLASSIWAILLHIFAVLGGLETALKIYESIK